MEVVAITPLTVEVMTPLLALSVLELMREEVEITPLTTEVNSFTAEDREFWLMKLAVVVEITPLTLEVRRKELVEVEVVRMLVVPEAKTAVRLVVAKTPFTLEESTVPVKSKVLLFIILAALTEPPILEVKVLLAEIKLFEAVRLPVVKDPVFILEKVEFGD
jgi:hypothetical protein